MASLSSMWRIEAGSSGRNSLCISCINCNFVQSGKLDESVWACNDWNLAANKNCKSVHCAVYYTHWALRFQVLFITMEEHVWCRDLNTFLMYVFNEIAHSCDLWTCHCTLSVSLSSSLGQLLSVIFISKTLLSRITLRSKVVSEWMSDSFSHHWQVESGPGS